MAEKLNFFFSAILEAHDYVASLLPAWTVDFINLFLLVLLLFIYAVLVWKFYKYISNKNILDLDLRQYGSSDYSLAGKFFSVFFYFLEYILIIPFLVFIWFGFLTFFLIILAGELMRLEQVLIISAVVVAAIRMTSYYSRDLAEDISKLIPLTFLATSLLEPKFFTGNFVQNILTRFSQISDFFGSVVFYLTFIVLLELFFRFFESMNQVFLDEEEIEENQQEEL